MNTASEFLGKDSVFAKNLKALREEREISQKTLATAINASRQAVAQYEDGTALPNIEKLYKIADYFKVSTDFLLGISTIPNPDINDREIHNKLGLSSRAIAYLQVELESLYSSTNKNTPEEALNIQQQIKDFISRNRGNKGAVIAYARELGLPEKTEACEDIYSVAMNLYMSTPSFKTLNAIIADREEFEVPHKMNFKDDSIIEALETVFQYEVITPNVNYGIVENDNSKQSSRVVTDQKGGFLLGVDDIFSLSIVNLQNVLKKHCDKIRKRSNNE